MTLFLPRLSRSAFLRHMGALTKAGDAPDPMVPAEALGADVSWGATGGRTAGVEELRHLREALEGAARYAGFPEKSDRVRLAAFDAAAARSLALLPVLDTPDAMRDDVWAFAATVLAPDINFWRFGLEPSRFDGGVRNAFQRLWICGRLFDRGEGVEDRWGLLDALSEDAMVAITERGGVAGQPRLARGLAEAWVRARARSPDGSMETMMRRAVVAVRLVNEIRLLSILDNEELAAVLDAEFRRAELSLRIAKS